MMAFIGSVFNMIGSFISMVFGAVASVFHFVFSVLGGLLGLVLHLGMLLLVVGLVALDYAPQELQAVEGGRAARHPHGQRRNLQELLQQVICKNVLVLPPKVWYNQRYPKFSEVKKQ